MSHNLNQNDMDALAKTVFMEARGEPSEGQAAVTHVILQRAKLNKDYWGGDNVANVCKKPGQFECWNNPQHIDTNSQEYTNVNNVVHDVVYNNGYSNQNDGSDHYNNPSKEGYPQWTQNCNKTKEIGGHQFYKDKNH